MHQHINGAWRAGRTGRTMTDTDPCTNETLTEIVLSDAHDVGDAYEAAHKAQLGWAQALPAQRWSVSAGALRHDHREAIVAVVAAQLPLYAGAEQQTRGEIVYVTGGIGADEREQLKKMEKEFNLKLLFTQPDGHML